MKPEKQDDLRGPKIIASSLLLSLGVLSLTLALLSRRGEFAVIPAIISSIGLLLFIQSWSGRPLLRLLFGWIVSAKEYSDSYTERVLPDELKPHHPDKTKI